MKVLKVEKIKVGNIDGIIRVTYRNFFKTRVRDAARKHLSWKFIDNDTFVRNELPLDILEASDATIYEPNKNN